jgi:uncharacterized membrane protein YoaK (UPF0700 family)
VAAESAVTPEPEVEPARVRPLPRLVPVLLSFVAGYVDSFTFLGLFGLFAAQVTGTFIVAAAQVVTHDRGVVAKLAAVAGFLIAAILTTGFIAILRERGRAPLGWALILESVLLVLFASFLLSGSPVSSPETWGGIAAGLFAAMAMGSQSVLVRLLMRGIPQTNVMTGNMAQLGVEVVEWVLAWRRLNRNPDNPDRKGELASVRGRLIIFFAIAVAFLLGAAIGALSFVYIGLGGLLFAIALVAGLAIWALHEEPSPQKRERAPRV